MHMQLVITLAVLFICFMVAVICTFMIVFTTRNLQNRNTTNLRDQDEADAITREDSSCNSTNVKMKQARPSPTTRKTPGNETLNYGTNSGNFRDPSGPVNSNDSGIIFVDSNQTDSASLSAVNQDTDETSPLLKNKNSDEVSSTGFQFGIISEDTGLWYRDISGKHLIRFVILLLLLVFSSLVVSFNDSVPLFLDINRSHLKACS